MYKFWLIIKFSSSLFCCLNFCENILESSKAFCVGLSVNHLGNFDPPCFRGHRARDLLHALLHSRLLCGAPGINIFPIFLLRGNDGLLLDYCSSFLCLCIRILLRFLAQFFCGPAGSDAAVALAFSYSIAFAAFFSANAFAFLMSSTCLTTSSD